MIDMFGITADRRSREKGAAAGSGDRRERRAHRAPGETPSGGAAETEKTQQNLSGEAGGRKGTSRPAACGAQRPDGTPEAKTKNKTK